MKLIGKAFNILSDDHDTKASMHRDKLCGKQKFKYTQKKLQL